MRWKPYETRSKLQTRPYSTAATATDFRSMYEKSREATHLPFDGSQSRVVDLPQEREGESIFDDQVDAREGFANSNEEERGWELLEPWPTNSLGVTEQLDRQPGRKKALQYLAMKQLALKLLLRPSIAPGYAGIRVNYNVGTGLRRVDIRRMLDELQTVQKQMDDIRKSPKADFESVLPLMTPEQHARLAEERDDLHNQLQDIVDQYKCGRIPLDVLIVRIADNLVASKEPITPRAIPFLLDVFSTAKQRDIVLMVMDSLFPNGFLMTQHSISASITFFGNTYDLLGFKKFLERLQDPSCPIVRKPWVCTRVGDVDIPVPQGAPHPYTITSLIKTALNLDQPHKADAWFEYLQKNGYSDNAKILIAYIRYYAYHENWNKGVYFMYRAIKHLSSTGKIGRGDTLRRLVLFMVAFCNSCGKFKSARVILKAAVTSGIDSKQIHNDDRFEPVVRSLSQWEEFEAAAQGIKRDVPSDGAVEYQLFARKIEHHFRQELNAVRELVLKDKVAAASVVKSEVREEYEQTIFDLRNEMADLRMQLHTARSARQDEQIPNTSRRGQDNNELANASSGGQINWPMTAETKALDSALPVPENRKGAIHRPRKFIIRHQMSNPITDPKADGCAVNGIKAR